MTKQEIMLLRKTALLSCVKKGYISIKKATKQLNWSTQKVVVVGITLCEQGVLIKDTTPILIRGEICDKVVGFYLNSF